MYTVRAPNWATAETRRLAEVLSSIPTIWDGTRRDRSYILPDLGDIDATRRVFEDILLDSLDEQLLTHVLDFVGDLSRVSWRQMAVAFGGQFRTR